MPVALCPAPGSSLHSAFCLWELTSPGTYGRAKTQNLPFVSGWLHGALPRVRISFPSQVAFLCLLFCSYPLVFKPSLSTFLLQSLTWRPVKKAHENRGAPAALGTGLATPHPDAGIFGGSVGPLVGLHIPECGEPFDCQRDYVLAPRGQASPLHSPPLLPQPLSSQMPSSCPCAPARSPGTDKLKSILFWGIWGCFLPSCPTLGLSVSVSLSLFGPGGSHLPPSLASFILPVPSALRASGLLPGCPGPTLFCSHWPHLSVGSGQFLSLSSKITCPEFHLLHTFEY